MKRALILAAIMLLPNAGLAQERYLGEIDYFPYTFCPRDYLPADGRLLSIAQNQALFSLLGTTYGGNGQTTFALPMLKPLRSESGGLVTPCIVMQGVFPSRE